MEILLVVGIVLVMAVLALAGPVLEDLLAAAARPGVRRRRADRGRHPGPDR